MSGRLVILRHKSWNVWNADNREKVLRDERLNREAVEEAEKAERTRRQEEARGHLLSTQETSSSSKGHEQDVNETKTTSSASSTGADAEEVSRFDLFEGMEAKVAKRKREQEFQKQTATAMKKQGVAPWAFGEGSSEARKARSWYFEGRMDGGLSSSNASTLAFEAQRRRMEDPLTLIKKELGMSDSTGDIGQSDKTVADKSNNLSTESRDNSGNDERRNHSKKHHHKEKNHHHHRRSGGEISAEPCAGMPTHCSGSSCSGISPELMEELRRRRLEREKVEARRTAVLLAQRDIFGAAAGAAKVRRSW